MRLCLCVLAACLHAIPTFAAPRPKVALVLSGGGPRGMALLGVLKGLEEQRVPVDMVVGCSAGSLVGGLLAQGWSVERITAAVEGLDFFKLYDDSVPRAELPFRLKDKTFNYLPLNLGYGQGLRAPKGLSSGRRLRLLLRRLAVDAQGIRDFKQLPIPFLAAATDLSRARAAYLGEGDLGGAMMASMSVPASFAPMAISGASYSDGFIFQNLPIDGAKAAGADALIVVDITTAVSEKRDFASVLDTTFRLLDVVVGDTMAKQRALLGPKDVFLSPKVSFLGNFDYERAKEAVQPGLDAVREAAPKLKTLALGEAAYAAWRAARPPLRPARWMLRGVRAADGGLLSRYALERLRAKPGHALDLDELEADIEGLMASGRFEDVDYRLEDAHDGAADLVLDARPKSWGPDYFYIGFKLVADLEGFSQFETLLDLTQTGFSASDLELRHQLFFGRVNGYDGELFIPLQRSGLFVAPALLAENRSGLSQAQGRLDLGWVGRAAELRFGYQGGRLWIGSSGSVPVEVDVGMLRAQLLVDTLDDPHFPSQGLYLRAMAGEARRDAGSAPAYRVARGGFHAASHLGRNVLILGGELASAWDSQPPFFEQPSLGGYFRLSAFRAGALPGRETALARALYYYRSTKPMALLGKTQVLGLAYETGQAYAGSLDFHGPPWRQSLGVLIGASTPLGPAYLAHARNFEGGGVSYVFLGNPF